MSGKSQDILALPLMDDTTLAAHLCADFDFPAPFLNGCHYLQPA